MVKQTITTHNNEVALEFDGKFIYTGNLDSNQNPNGIGRLFLKSGGLLYKGQFDKSTVRTKIAKYKGQKFECDYCFDTNKVECSYCRGDLLYINGKVTECILCGGIGEIECNYCNKEEL